MKTQFSLYNRDISHNPGVIYIIIIIIIFFNESYAAQNFWKVQFITFASCKFTL